MKALDEYFLMVVLTFLQNRVHVLVTGAKCNGHSDPILRNLHWLPINECLTFKHLNFTYKALNGLTPIYISELLEPYRPPRLLRSAQRNLLKVPNTRTITYGNRAFSYAAPTLWNSLPEPLKTAESLGVFKTALKTFLFSKWFS